MPQGSGTVPHASGTVPQEVVQCHRVQCHRKWYSAAGKWYSAAGKWYSATVSGKEGSRICQGAQTAQLPTLRPRKSPTVRAEGPYRRAPPPTGPPVPQATNVVRVNGPGIYTPPKPRRPPRSRALRGAAALQWSPKYEPGARRPPRGTARRPLDAPRGALWRPFRRGNRNASLY